MTKEKTKIVHIPTKIHIALKKEAADKEMTIEALVAEKLS